MPPEAGKPKQPPAPRIESWGEFEPGDGFLVGLNFYPFDTRNHRLNVQVIDVHRSPVNSTFGYYTGGQDGTTASAAFSVFSVFF